MSLYYIRTVSGKYVGFDLPTQPEPQALQLNDLHTPITFASTSPIPGPPFTQFSSQPYPFILNYDGVAYLTPSAAQNQVWNLVRAGHNAYNIVAQGTNQAWTAGNQGEPITITALTGKSNQVFAITRAH